MNKRIVWRKVRIWSVDRRMSVMRPPIISRGSGEDLLKEIRAMPSEGKRPLSFQEAYQIFTEAFHRHLRSPDSTLESSSLFHDNMIPWLTEQGYFIQLTGDEYIYEEQRDLKDEASKLDIEDAAACLRFGLDIWESINTLGPRGAEEICECIPDCAFREFWLECISLIKATDCAIGIFKHVEQQFQQGKVSKKYLEASRTILEFAKAWDSGVVDDFFVQGTSLKRVA